MSTKLTCIVCGGGLVACKAPLSFISPPRRQKDLSGNDVKYLECTQCGSKHTLTHYPEEPPYLSLKSTNHGRK